jgi:isocitrate/isopropylmalate dehydrogenase
VSSCQQGNIPVAPAAMQRSGYIHTYNTHTHTHTHTHMYIYTDIQISIYPNIHNIYMYHCVEKLNYVMFGETATWLRVPGKQNTSTYVSIRQHTSAYVSIRPCCFPMHWASTVGEQAYRNLFWKFLT